jgi:hypothetical protein
MNKDSFTNNGEDIYVHRRNGTETGIYITKVSPYSIGNYRKTNTSYIVQTLRRKYAEVSNLTIAKRLAIKHAQ